MRLRVLPAVLAAALAGAAPAAAAGPVFVVVSSSPAASSATADRGAPAGAKRERQRIDRALAHAQEVALTAPLLSDRLAAEKAVFQLQTAGGLADGTVSRLEDQVASLEAAATPAEPAVPQVAAPIPALDPFSAAASIGVQASTIALRYLGVPYVWGGADPVTGFDCSGLVQYVYGQLGIGLSHYTGTQFGEGVPVAGDQLRAGDLVFFEPGVAGPGHEGIYIGSGEVVQAPHSGAVVQVSSLATMIAQDGWVGAVRPYVMPAAFGGF